VGGWGEGGRKGRGECKIGEVRGEEEGKGDREEGWVGKNVEELGVRKGRQPGVEPFLKGISPQPNQILETRQENGEDCPERRTNGAEKKRGGLKSPPHSLSCTATSNWGTELRWGGEKKKCENGEKTKKETVFLWGATLNPGREFRKSTTRKREKKESWKLPFYRTKLKGIGGSTPRPHQVGFGGSTKMCTGGREPPRGGGVFERQSGQCLLPGMGGKRVCRNQGKKNLDRKKRKRGAEVRVRLGGKRTKKFQGKE